MFALALLLCSHAWASPNPAKAEQAMVTPSPSLSQPPSRTWELKPRDNLFSEGAGYLSSVLGGLGSSLPSEVASGVPNFFENFPTGDAVQRSLGLDDSQVAALPTQVLNIPPYGNYTDQGWQIRFRANVYKQPNIPQSKLDDLANVFLVDTSVQSLPPSQAAQARNLTAEIFVIQQENQNLTFSLAPAPTSAPDGGAVRPPGSGQIINYPIPTTDQGDIDGFVRIESDGLQPGNETSTIQRLSIWTNGTDTGNATAYLVPPTGLTTLSDIDDILRVTKIYQPKEGLLNSFARPFTPWMNMPEIYANWSKTLNGHFHYLTTTPEQATRNYMDFIFNNYPPGSFDTRPLNFSDVSATLSIRRFLLDKIFQTFPRRKFILVGDVSNSDIMREYPKLATDYPGQVQCIFLRNTTATDDDKFPYDTSGFKGLDQSMYMFFVVPDDLSHLDIAKGQCYNASIKQNLTFGYQGLPFGLSTGKSESSATGRSDFFTLMGTTAWLVATVSLCWLLELIDLVLA